MIQNKFGSDTASDLIHKSRIYGHWSMANIPLRTFIDSIMFGDMNAVTIDESLASGRRVGLVNV